MRNTPLKDMIRMVNGRVNVRPDCCVDLTLYDLRHFWTEAIARFDHDDGPISKAVMLLDMGFPNEQMRLAKCKTKAGHDHAVLLCEVEDGEWVLDTLHFYICRLAETGYRLTAIQEPEMNSWVPFESP